MGDIADMLVEQELMRHAWSFEEFLDLQGEAERAAKKMLKRNLKARIWQTKDGRSVHLADMDTAHVENAAAFCRRNPENALGYVGKWIPVFEAELARRQEAAQAALASIQ